MEQACRSWLQNRTKMGPALQAPASRLLWGTRLLLPQQQLHRRPPLPVKEMELRLRHLQLLQRKLKLRFKRKERSLRRLHGPQLLTKTKLENYRVDCLAVI